MSCTMSWAVLLLLLCLTTVISSTKTKPKFPFPNLNVTHKKPSAPESVMTYIKKIYESKKSNWTSCTDGLRCNKTLLLGRVAGYHQPVFDRKMNISHDLRAKFQFQIDKEDDFRLLATEFRIYKQSTPLTKVCQNNTYVVRLYQINYPGQASNLLETRVLRSSDEGWQFFDISQTGKMWEENPSTNYGLELAVENSLNLKLNPFKAGFVGFGGPQKFRPFIVSFLKIINPLKSLSSFPFKIPNVQQSDCKVDRLVESEIRREPGSDKRSYSRSCQRYPWRLDMSQFTNVLVPPVLDMYVCKGECSLSVIGNNRIKSTLHAANQAIEHSYNPDTIPKPCCAPTKLSGTDMITIDEGLVKIQRHNDVVVEECGCL